jgi:alginate O-acetyltransferase complex protein AlgI
MLLHTPAYLLFLLFSVIVYWVLPKQVWRKYLLLGASYFFYALFDLRFLALLFSTSILTYTISARIPRRTHPRRYVWLSVLMNLSVLGVFKYANFFLESLQAAFRAMGFDSFSPGLSLLLPIGISFYTFQAISYTIEIYKGKMQPAKRLVDFLIYMAFFPKLIAGPFVRPRHFLAQLDRPAATPTQKEFTSALGLLLLGVAKKILISDSLASLADVSFRAAAIPIANANFPTPLYIQGFYLYAFLIYADFSGYTDIARASAALLGFHLPENFQQPYLSTTITSFWNRWHQSLTQWFREYLFFPISRSMLLATKRRYQAFIQTAANLITMTLIGLWHGAAWTFIAWGLWHGILLTMEHSIRLKPIRRWTALLSGIITFHLVGVGWILFNSSTFISARRFFEGLFSFEQMGWLPYYLPSILLTATLIFSIDLARSGRLSLAPRLPHHFLKQTVTIATLVTLFCLAILSYARGTSAQPFIYGQF